MSKIINLEEIALAKKVTKDFPDAIQKLDNCLNLLYNYRDYIDIAKVNQQIIESKYLMELTLEVYTELLNKGKNE